MKTISFILLLIVVSVGVIVVFFPDIINTILPATTKQTTTKPQSKCVEKSLAIDIYYPPSPSAWDEDAQGYRKPKNVNDINECKNECDKYTGCKSYSYNSGNKLCWLGSSFTFEPASEPSLVTSCVK